MRQRKKARLRKRRGISLVELMVAVTLIGLIVTAHTMVTIKYAVMNRTSAIGVDRAAAISTAVDLYSTMPFASLSGATGCTTITTMVNYVHERCVSISNPTQAIRRVEIIIRPTNAAFRSDTVRVDRSLPPTGSLFS